MHEYGQSVRQRYADIINRQLDDLISIINLRFPNCGYRFALSVLQSVRYRVIER